MKNNSLESETFLLRNHKFYTVMVRHAPIPTLRSSSGGHRSSANEPTKAQASAGFYGIRKAGAPLISRCHSPQAAQVASPLAATPPPSQQLLALWAPLRSFHCRCRAPLLILLLRIINSISFNPRPHCCKFFSFALP